MGKDDLERLLEAENDAQRTLSLWKERAEKAVKDASTDMDLERERALSSIRARFSADMETTRVLATAEAEKIKNDGVELAKGLRSRARSRVGQAVESALVKLLG